MRPRCELKSRNGFEVVTAAQGREVTIEVAAGMAGLTARLSPMEAEVLIDGLQRAIRAARGAR